MAIAKRDANSVTTLLGQSNADGVTPLPLYVDSATNRLLVDAVGTITGTQYTEGDTDASITGQAILWEDSSDTLRAVSAAKPLPVDLQDSTVAVTQSGNWSVRLTDGTDSADILDLTNSNPLVVAIVDSNGDQVTSFGGGTQYTEDAAAAANPVGNALILVREDGRAGSLTSTDGDNVAARGNNKGELYVIDTDANAKLSDIAANTDSIATDSSGIRTAVEHIDLAIHAEDDASANAHGGMGLLAVRKATPANTSGTDGDYEFLQMSAGRLWVDPSGVTLTVASHAVTNAGTFAVQESGSALTALQLIDDVIKTDDAAFSPATDKVAMIGAQVDDTSTDSVDEGDAGAVRMSTNRNLYVRVRDNAGNERGLNIDASSRALVDVNGWGGAGTPPAGNGTVSVSTPRVTLASDSTGNIATIGTSVTPGTGASNLGKAEDAAHTTGDVGVMTLAVRAASPTDRSAGPTDGDYEPLGVNEVGALWVTPTVSANGGASTMNATSSDGATALTSTAQAIKASAGCLYGYYIYNPNSSAQFVQFYNTASGSVTVGTTNPLFMLTIPATSAANLFMETGIQFSTAISWAATSTAGGNGAPTTALDAVAWYR